MPWEERADQRLASQIGRPIERPGVRTNVPAVAVRLVDVVKRFGDVAAVDHIDLEVQDGEFFSLLGPSGCGKTTTLRMIAGFEEPTSGVIELQGEDVTWLPPFRRNVNTVFQNYALFPHLTIYENVAFGLRRKGIQDPEVKTRVSEMLELVELPGFERRKPTQISGGQAQRVALARALINRPSVLLLDEPLGALDLKLRKQMQVELKRIQQEVGITFIFVTHDQEEAMTMSDRIAVMNHGRYEQLADPASLYERPRTRFVAGFLGVSNLLPTKPDGTTDGAYVVCRLADGTAIRVPKTLTEGFETFEVGVRPEKIRLRETNEAVPEGQNHMLGTIRDASYLGVSTSYIVEARGGGTVTVYEQNVERATRAELWTPGEEVQMTWSPDHTFAVDATGTPPPSGPVGAVAGLAAGDDGAVPVAAAGVSRRNVLIAGAVGVVAVGFAAFLANSSGGGTAPSASPAGSAAAPTPTPSPVPATTVPGSEPPVGPTPEPPQTGTIRFANWPSYIDINEDTKEFPTLLKFEAETGIKVDYIEAVDGNESFFTTHLSGPLNAGLPTEWDIVVVTDWMVARLARLGWLETLQVANTPNFVANLAPVYRARSFDPNTNLAAPWQSGMTGLGFDFNVTGEQNSIDILFSDDYGGRMTYLDEMRDTVGLSALRLGSDPASITEVQFQAALAEVDKAVKAGYVRQVVGNSYFEVMARGDAVLAMAWSGDVLTSLVPDQVPPQDFRWVLATEGGMLWTDNMVVPKGSPNRRLAESWIDFYYDPANAATVAAYVNYVCPVLGAREVMLELDAELANNPLIFPPEDYVARLHQFRDTTAEEETAWSEAFTKALGL
jgi:spermidine/putrescine transport system ATP-binding protein